MTNPLDEFRVTRRQVEQGIRIAAGIVLLVLLFLVARGSWFMLDAQRGEHAVIQRFGRYFSTVTEPGLHFKLPFGIDEVTTERVQEVRRVEVGFRTAPPSRYERTERVAPAHDEPQHSISITRDHNLVDAEYVVQYEISDLRKYLFSSSLPDWTVSQAIKAVMRDVVANRDIDDILTSARDEMQQEALRDLQVILDRYDLGIRIKAVQFQDVHAPRPVIPAFDDVQKAKEEMETSINEGKRYRNTVLPRAEGEAKRMVTEAEAYKIRRLNEAAGDAARFQALYERYKADPELTRRQLYLQVMAEVLPGMEKTIIEGDPARFLLPLDSLKEKK